MGKVIRKMEADIPSFPLRKRVAAYARVSSGKDAMLHSLSAQVSYYSDHIQKNPEWEYAGVYVDEALTGTKDNREGFQRLLADCRAGKIDMVLTKSISRFARRQRSASSKSACESAPFFNSWRQIATIVWYRSSRSKRSGFIRPPSSISQTPSRPAR